STIRQQLLYITAFYFFTAPHTSSIYTLSLHDAFRSGQGTELAHRMVLAGRNNKIFGSIVLKNHPHTLHIIFGIAPVTQRIQISQDRKSTRLNSSHVSISYAVYCLKKKNENKH